jgi:DNA-binding MarR family transcriptional regulator
MARRTSRGSKRTPASKRELVERLGAEVRRTGAQSVLISHAVAERFGLHMTDLEVLDLIALREQASAGELAQATGLTSGSVTALIDRLADAGYVERHHDPDDRRRVLVRIRREAVAPIAAVYMPMQTRVFELWSSYSAQELELISDFLARSNEVAVACTDEIRGAAPARARQPAKARRRKSLPRAG